MKEQDQIRGILFRDLIEIHEKKNPIKIINIFWRIKKRFYENIEKVNDMIEDLGISIEKLSLNDSNYRSNSMENDKQFLRSI